jgi:hypothetical protein
MLRAGGPVLREVPEAALVEPVAERHLALWSAAEAALQDDPR